ncbi:MAG TPA: hypothetical protein VFZ44_07025 [Pyrinomonadaceae bacterium]
MKLLPRLLGFAVSLIAFGVVIAVPQDPCSLGTEYRNCRACGTAKSKKVQQLNVDKNRDEPVTNPRQVTFQELRNPKKKFSTKDQVWMTGYVASVTSGGNQESCNCERDDLRDIHVNVVAHPSEVGNLSKYVVVEFTPRWQEKLNIDDSNYKEMLKKVRKEIGGKWVRFEGWMLYDHMHDDAAKTTRPKQKPCPDDGKIHKKCNWRATPWEIHPITSYKVVSGPN